MRRQAAQVTGIGTPNSAEGVIATINAPLFGGDPAMEPPGGTLVDAVVNITPGAGTTALVFRVRKGSGTSGAVVGTSQTVPGAAATAQSVCVQAFDNNPVVGQYTVTVSQTGGTGAGTVNVAVVTATAA